MGHLISLRMRDLLAKTMGLASSADAIRKKKFNRLIKEDWHSPPDRFCREEKKIHPKLIGRFYGENNLKKSALEIKRLDDGRLVLRCVFKPRSRATWSDPTLARKTDRYFSLVVRAEQIGTQTGLNFRRGPDGRYYLGYKNNMEIIMKKV